MLNNTNRTRWVAAISAPIFCFFLASLGTPPVVKVTLQEAIQKKLVLVDLVSNGGYNHKSVAIKLTNNSSSALNLVIPAGSVFHPADDGEQTLLQLEDKEILVQGKGTFNGTLDAFCTEASDRCPSESSTFKTEISKNTNLTKLVNYLKENKVPSNYYQDAIWAITDGHNVSNISVDYPSTKKLRTFLCELTGQKDSWYSSPREVQVDPYGNFNFETVKVSGDLDFNCHSGKKITEYIVKENGDVMYTGSSTFTPQSNHLKYGFNLSVKGWEKGTYFVQIKDVTGELARFEFKV